MIPNHCQVRVARIAAELRINDNMVSLLLLCSNLFSARANPPAFLFAFQTATAEHGWFGVVR